MLRDLNKHKLNFAFIKINYFRNFFYYDYIKLEIVQYYCELCCHHTSSFLAFIPKIPVVSCHQAITSRVDRIAFKSPVTYVEKYLYVSASFVELSACPLSRRYLSRREWKDLRGFRSGCCIADKVFPDGARSRSYVSTTRMSHVRFMPLRTWREFRWIPGWNRNSLMITRAHRYVLSCRISCLYLLVLFSAWSLLISSLHGMCNEGINFFEFRIKGY